MMYMRISFINSCLPQKNRELAELKEYILFGLMDYMCPEILSHDTIPSAPILIHLHLEVS